MPSFSSQINSLPLMYSGRLSTLIVPGLPRHSMWRRIRKRSGGPFPRRRVQTADDPFCWQRKVALDPQPFAIEVVQNAHLGSRQCRSAVSPNRALVLAPAKSNLCGNVGDADRPAGLTGMRAADAVSGCDRSAFVVSVWYGRRPDSDPINPPELSASAAQRSLAVGRNQYRRAVLLT